MLVQLGRRSPQAQSLEEQLRDCHGRIRNFSALARRLAEGPDPVAARDAALALERYFGIALRLHIADEEESLAPRLMSLGDRVVEAAVDTMMSEHVQIDERLDELINRWREIAAQPTPARCLATHGLATAIAAHFGQHLDSEEQLIFPSLARLPEAQARAIAAEMRARRGG
jgi:iron-sulfur cluster repair protein YtfE (RIC family)